VGREIGATLIRQSGKEISLLLIFIPFARDRSSLNEGKWFRDWICFFVRLR